VSSEQPNAIAATEDFEFAALNEARNYRRALIGEFSPYLRGRVAEVGAGIGQLTAELASVPTITQLTAVEPEQRFAERLRRDQPTRTVIHGTAADLPVGDGWNAIVSVNVLEHIREDVEELKRWRGLLAPARGHLCLFVPARPELYAPIDKDFGHFRRYTKPGLRQALTDAGFEIVRCDYFNAVGYFAWWASFVLLGQREFKVGSVRLFDRAIFPLVHAWERNVLRPPFGQSLMAVARA
jgi:SAM-dependent methyltransferase